MVGMVIVDLRCVKVCERSATRSTTPPCKSNAVCKAIAKHVHLLLVKAPNELDPHVRVERVLNRQIGKPEDHTELRKLL